jgi:hypothetical protein
VWDRKNVRNINLGCSAVAVADATVLLLHACLKGFLMKIFLLPQSILARAPAADAAATADVGAVNSLHCAFKLYRQRLPAIKQK